MFKHLLVVALLALATLSVGTPAQASTITGYMYCEPLGAQRNGWGAALCRVYLSGGTGIYSYTWNAPPIHAYSDGAQLPCGLGAYATIIVTVTDSNGAIFTTSDTFLCNEADLR